MLQVRSKCNSPCDYTHVLKLSHIVHAHSLHTSLLCYLQPRIPSQLCLPLSLQQRLGHLSPSRSPATSAHQGSHNPFQHLSQATSVVDITSPLSHAPQSRVVHMEWRGEPHFTMHAKWRCSPPLCTCGEPVGKGHTLGGHTAMGEGKWEEGRGEGNGRVVFKFERPSHLSPIRYTWTHCTCLPLFLINFYVYIIMYLKGKSGVQI